ncbi:MAG: ComEC/Rec2 family competence protein [Deltaproteobacteria bacterium]|nr:ComEC/Rec2 family competence protein [Deltaproteobacteria bacterium]
MTSSIHARSKPFLAALAIALASCDLGDLPDLGPGRTEEDPLEAVFIDVGQGDSALFTLPDGAVVLVDGGDEGAGLLAVLPVLDERGIGAIDLLVLTHPHADHCGGLDEVLQRVAVDEIWENGETADTPAYEDFAAARDASGARVAQPKVGESRVFGDVSLEVLATASGFPGQNNDSIVLALRYGDVGFLLAGDAEAEEQRDLLSAHGGDLGADVLKVPHHGSSNFDPGFPRAVSPRFGVISCGADNEYGHPTSEALAAYGSLGATVCRTDVLGDVAFRTDGADLESSCAGL